MDAEQKTQAQRIAYLLSLVFDALKYGQLDRQLIGDAQEALHLLGENPGARLEHALAALAGGNPDNLPGVELEALENLVTETE